MKILKKFCNNIKPLNLLFLTIGGIINAIGVTLLLSPSGLLDSGFSGTALLLNSAFSVVPLSAFLIILNFPFYIFAVKKIGWQFMFYSLYAISIYSLFAFVFKDILKLNDLCEGKGLFAQLVGGDIDILLSAVFGGLLSGIGSGITIRYGGALDGVEVLAVMFSKFIGITVGTFVMIYNVILYSAAAIVNQSLTEPLYSIISYFVGIKTIDLLVEGLDKAKQVMIITTMPDEICNDLSAQFGRGLTIINAKGYYSQQEKTVIYCIANRFEIGRIKKVINSIDSNAFVSITETSETIGRKKPNKRYKAIENAINQTTEVTPENYPVIENEEVKLKEVATDKAAEKNKTEANDTNKNEEHI